MQINKKLFSTAITALLVLSVIAAAAPALAFDATSTVNLTVATGPVGTQVTVSGAAAGSPVGANPFGPIGVYWDNLGTLLNGNNFANPDGSYSVNIRIPSATAGVHFIIVQDSLGTTASAQFTVTPSLAASVTPSTGTTVLALPGDTVTFTGHGFRGTSGPTTTTVTLTYASTTLVTPVTGTFAGTVTTNATGSFVTSVVIPALTPAQYDTYTITATDNAAVPNIATTSIGINYYVRAVPSQGPPGITTTFSGRIPLNTAYTITLSGPGVASTQIAAGTSSATGAFSNTYTVPALLAANPYVITVSWSPVVTDQVTTTFTVTAAPTVTLSAATGVPGAVITVTGANFVDRADITLSFGTTVVNSTALDSRFGPTSATGTFTEEFSVPNLAPGTYPVTVVDEFGASASVVGGFTVNPAPVTTISTADTFAQGDTISFIISTTDPAVLSVGVYIKDPSGMYWWGTPASPMVWATTAITASQRVVLYTAQISPADALHLTLPANAPTGAWNWTVAYTPGTGVATTQSGLFNVIAGGAAGITTQLNNITAKLDNMTMVLTSINGTVATLQSANGTSILSAISALDAKVTSITGGIATLTTNMGTVTASVNSLSGTITGISSSVSGLSSAIATVQTNLGTVQTALSNLDPVVGLIAGDTTILKTSVGEISTSLSTIGTRVTSLEGDIATIQTDLGTLSGTVTSISGNIATIQTSLGTMQADISDLQADISSTKGTTEGLSPLIIAAIVLALIAAIAAIASIVMMRRKIAS